MLQTIPSPSTAHSGSSDWWNSSVIYQIYLRSFQDTNGDGIGDLQGIVQRLDYLVWLGIDAIWISPFYPSPMADFGYDITDYTNVDAQYGTLEDFDWLLHQAHARNLKVILDFVPNHTSIKHPWFQASRSSKTNPKRNWYIWQDAKPDGSAPNNWHSCSNGNVDGSAWTFDAQTEQYYLSSFSPMQPDLNWRNPEVRAAMLNAMRFWLDRGVDGFRIDMLDFFVKDEQFRDEPFGVDGSRYEFATALYHLNQPETKQYIREMRQVVKAYPERVLIGEINYFLPLDNLAAFYGNGDLLDLPFNFRLTFLPLQARVIREFIDAYETALPPHAQPNYTLGNHDRPRVSRHGHARARLAAMLLLTLRGTPFLYYGDELGMKDVEIPLEKAQDPWRIKETGLSRDPARTPMQWSAESWAGFSTVEPWLPIDPNYSTLNADVQAKDPLSLLTLYKQLLALRRRTPALYCGSYHALEIASEDCFVYLRQYDQQQVMIVLNFSDQSQQIQLPKATWKIYLSTHLDRSELVEDRIYLRPCEGLVLMPVY
jgi:alpha-glucosidase